MVNSVLEVIDLHKRYGSRVAVEKVSFSIAAGEIFGLLGPNGSGKSTTLHVITGLLTGFRGSVRVCGTSINDKKSRRHFGFAPDDLPLPTALTGWEYLQLHDRLRRLDTSSRSREFAWVWGLEDDLDRLVSHYSHGMKRKLQLVAALAHQPELLILDEPFRGLDPESGALLRVMIRCFADQGGSVCMATHDMIRAESQCDTVAILSDGSLVAQGTPEELRTHYGVDSLESVFLKTTGLDQSYGDREAILHHLLVNNVPV